MKTIFDIGMFNGFDTTYYLELGFKVVAVEANPVLVERAALRFRGEIEGGRLTLINGAISDIDGDVSLVVSGDDVGSSSILSSHVQRIQPIGAYTVPSIRFLSLIERHGVPHFLKVDIEGSDRHCILPLSATSAPQFLSFEIGPDFEELFAHACSIGYDHFKIIDQTIFRDLSGLPLFSDRVRFRLMRYLGLGSPRTFRRDGRFFSSGSSGPVPWRSGGRWLQAKAVEALWTQKLRSGENRSWHDLQATRGS